MKLDLTGMPFSVRQYRTSIIMRHFTPQCVEYLRTGRQESLSNLNGQKEERMQINSI